VDASHREAVEELEERFLGEMDCLGLKSSTAVDQRPRASRIAHSGWSGEHTDAIEDGLSRTSVKTAVVAAT